jgi:hypothetical protein
MYIYFAICLHLRYFPSILLRSAFWRFVFTLHCFLSFTPSLWEGRVLYRVVFKLPELWRLSLISIIFLFSFLFIPYSKLFFSLRLFARIYLHNFAYILAYDNLKSETNKLQFSLYSSIKILNFRNPLDTAQYYCKKRQYVLELKVISEK